MTSAAIVIVCVVALLIFVTLVAGLAMVLSSNELVRHHKRTLESWEQEGVKYVYGPAIASFLNERRRFGGRGNGTLAVTTSDVRFTRPVANQPIVIPVRELSDAFTLDAFNGWNNGGPFFIVKRTSGDLTGFKVANAEKWAEAVRGLIANAPPLAEVMSPAAG